jgi:hypothetical protein
MATCGNRDPAVRVPSGMEHLRRAWLVGLVTALAVSGCSSPAGRPGATGSLSEQQHGGAGVALRVDVTGRLEGVGGPAPGAPRRWPGTVSWSGPTHGTVRVGTDGRFVLSLPAGRYRLTGHSPRYGDGDYLCVAPHPLVVRTGAPAHLDVLCQMM